MSYDSFKKEFPRKLSGALDAAFREVYNAGMNEAANIVDAHQCRTDKCNCMADVQIEIEYARDKP